jgi:hypothetical protein
MLFCKPIPITPFLMNSSFIQHVLEYVWNMPGKVDESGAKNIKVKDARLQCTRMPLIIPNRMKNRRPLLRKAIAKLYSPESNCT